MQVVLGYEQNHLWMEPKDMPLDEFLRSSLWKVRLAAAKAKRPEAVGQRLFFSSDLDVNDCQTIYERLVAAKSYGLDLVLDSSYSDTIVTKAGLLEERAQAGLAIKAHDESVIARFEEFSFVVDSHMERKLRERQMWDAFFMCVVGRSANFSVPGSGKTASVLGTYAYLHARGEADRIVVISPKNAFESWRDEWAACFGKMEPCHSLCFHDKKWSGISRSSRMNEIGLSYKRYNLILLNYESANYGDSLFRAVGLISDPNRTH